VDLDPGGPKTCGFGGSGSETLMDRHRVDACPDPTFYFDADPDQDPDPTPSFTHVRKSDFKKTYSQQRQYTLFYLSRYVSYVYLSR